MPPRKFSVLLSPAPPLLGAVGTKRMLRSCSFPSWQARNLVVPVVSSKVPRYSSGEEVAAVVDDTSIPIELKEEERQDFALVSKPTNKSSLDESFMVRFDLSLRSL